MTANLWNCEKEVKSFGVEVPEWVDQSIVGSTVAAINQGGCNSGAYMPAVTYCDALAIMAEHGDDVIEYIDDNLGLQQLSDVPSSWSGMCCYYLSTAVELWAIRAEEELLVILGDNE